MRRRRSLAFEMVLGPVRAFLTLAVLYALAILLYVERPLAAYICPECFGLRQTAPGLFLDEPAMTRRALILREAAARRVAAALPGADTRAVLLICRTAECDARIAGPSPTRRTLAVAYGWTFVRVTPAGLTEDVLTHELVHIALHRRIGMMALATGKLPAWWNEGLATIVAEGTPRGCPAAAGALPETPLEWRRTIATSRASLYRLAACRTQDWLDRNGGMSGAMAMLDDLRAGGDFSR